MTAHPNLALPTTHPVGLPPHPCPLLQMVLSEVSSSSPTALQAVRLLAVYLKDGLQKEGVLEQVGAWTIDPTAASNPTVLLVAAMVYALEDNYVEALRICHNAANLEL